MGAGLQQPDILDRCRHHLGELHQHGFVAIVEIGGFPVRELDQPEVAAILGDQRHRQPAAHGGMAVPCVAKASPGRMVFQFVLGQSHGLVAHAHQPVDARSVGMVCIGSPLAVFVGERNGVDRLGIVEADGQAQDGLVAGHQLARYLHGPLQHIIGTVLARDVDGRLREPVELRRGPVLLALAQPEFAHRKASRPDDEQGQDHVDQRADQRAHLPACEDLAFRQMHDDDQGQAFNPGKDRHGPLAGGAGAAGPEPTRWVAVGKAVLEHRCAALRCAAG